MELPSIWTRIIGAGLFVFGLVVCVAAAGLFVSATEHSFALVAIVAIEVVAGLAISGWGGLMARRRTGGA